MPSPLTVSRDHLRAAFLAWERVQRAGLTRSLEETAAMAVEQVADENSAHFFERLIAAGACFDDAPVQTPAQPKLPAIGEHWPEQGGIYAGQVLDERGQFHLILATAKPDGPLAWQPAMDWAAGLQHEGHADWSLPTRTESAVLYEALRNQFEPYWHWTSTQYSRDLAWTQYFVDGSQVSHDKAGQGRVRAVRRFSVQSFDHSKVAA